MIKERIDNERKELQISIDKDRDNVTRRLAEEHDMRRIEQMEMQQRLDNISGHIDYNHSSFRRC